MIRYSGLRRIFVLAKSKRTAEVAIRKNQGASVTTSVSLLWLGIAPSAIGFVLIKRGLRTVSASSAAAGLLVFPPVASVTAYFLLGETLTLLKIFGGLCILAGIALIRLDSEQNINRRS